jgi:hypothetical protein
MGHIEHLHDDTICLLPVFSLPPPFARQKSDSSSTGAVASPYGSSDQNDGDADEESNAVDDDTSVTTFRSLSCEQDKPRRLKYPPSRVRPRNKYAMPIAATSPILTALSTPGAFSMSSEKEPRFKPYPEQHRVSRFSLRPCKLPHHGHRDSSPKARIAPRSVRSRPAVSDFARFAGCVPKDSFARLVLAEMTKSSNSAHTLAQHSKDEYGKVTREIEFVERLTVSASHKRNKLSRRPQHSNRAGVHFAHPVVTMVRYRPKTTQKDITKLYFFRDEVDGLERDRETTPADAFECIANFRNSLLVGVSIAHQVYQVS